MLHLRSRQSLLDQMADRAFSARNAMWQEGQGASHAPRDHGRPLLHLTDAGAPADDPFIISAIGAGYTELSQADPEDGAGSLAADPFRGDASATYAGNHILFDSATGVLGFGAAGDHFAMLSAGFALPDADFIL